MQYQRIDALTSLRFFAAAMVVAFHSRHSFGGFTALDHYSLTQAVSMFFVLSGFILSHAHKEIVGARGLAMYYVSRVARIFPLHIACLLVVIYIMSVYGASVSSSTLVMNALLLQSWVPDSKTYFSLNGVSWSLSVELFFYAIFPLLIVSAKKAWHLQLAITIAVTAFMLAAFKYSEREWMLWSSYIAPVTRLSEFCLGIATYQVFLKVRPMDVTKWVATLAEVMTIALCVGMMWFGEINYFSKTPFALSKPVAMWFANCGGGLSFAVLIMVFSLQRGIISRCLNARGIVYLGEISFSLYMVHQVVLRLMELYPWMIAGLSPLYQFLAYYIACVLVSVLTYELIETPCRKLITGAAKRALNPIPSFS